MDYRKIARSCFDLWLNFYLELKKLEQIFLIEARKINDRTEIKKRLADEKFGKKIFENFCIRILENNQFVVDSTSSDKLDVYSGRQVKFDIIANPSPQIKQIFPKGKYIIECKFGNPYRKFPPSENIERTPQSEDEYFKHYFNSLDLAYHHSFFEKRDTFFIFMTNRFLRNSVAKIMLYYGVLILTPTHPPQNILKLLLENNGLSGQTEYYLRAEYLEQRPFFKLNRFNRFKQTVDDDRLLNYYFEVLNKIKIETNNKMICK